METHQTWDSCREIWDFYRDQALGCMCGLEFMQGSRLRVYIGIRVYGLFRD